MTIEVCPACGYPTVGPDLCAFCSSEVALTVDQPFEPILSATKLSLEAVRDGTRQSFFTAAAHVS